jgi:hypothetical protein
MDPPSPGAPPPLEVEELMKVFDWQENDIASLNETKNKDFDELELPYKTFNDYVVTKCDYLSSYLSH